MGLIILSTVWVAKQLVPAALLNGDFNAILNQVNGNLDASNLANLAVTTAKLAVKAVDGTKIGMGSDAQGDILYYNGASYARLAAGTAGYALLTGGAGANPAWGFQNVFGGALLHVRDEKTNNTAGGTFTAGAWRTRDLQTVKTNEIAGASLASNQITLPAGTYFIIATAPARMVNLNKIKLYNITDSADIIVGASQYTDSSCFVDNNLLVQGRFTLAAQKVLEVQHYGATTMASSGFGLATNFGVVEVYTEVLIWRVA